MAPDKLPSSLQHPPGHGELTLRQPFMLQQVADGVAPDDDGAALTLGDLLAIVIKHKWTLLLVLALSVAVAAINTFLQRPTYRATAVLQIDRAPARIVDFKGGNADYDAAMSDEYTGLKTQYELLRSRSLAERVIDDMQLDRSRSGAGGAKAEGEDAATQALQAASADGFVGRIISGYRKLSTPSTTDTQVLSREAVVGAFRAALVVDPVQNSRLVRLSIDNADPALAAKIANATAQTFVAMGQERRIESSSYAKTFLEDQIRQMKAKLEQSERRLNQYAQQKEILTLDEKTNTISQTYQEFAGALAKAEQERIRAEALYNEVRANPDRVLQMHDNKSVVATFKEQRAKLELEYQQNLRVFKADFPKMQQLQAQITEIDAQIKREQASAVAGVKSQLDAAVAQEKLLRDRLQQTRKQVLTTQDNSIDLNLLRREVDTSRQLYDNLLERLKQVNISSNLTTNNISIVDAATTPLFPYKPNLHTNVLSGLGIGLFLGLCLVFLLEYLDDSIRFPEMVERVLGVPLMGVIPVGDRKRSETDSVALEVHSDPRSSLAEAYRSVRTALQFSTSHGAPRRLLVTSTTRDEGKSTTALALAINFAQMGHKVLLVDGDMRNPSVHKMLGISNERGLSNLLSDDSQANMMVQQTVVPGLLVLTAGPPPPNPVDLLMGPKMRQLLDLAPTVGYSHVIVDGPPVLGIADSVVLGNQIQDTLFIVRAGSTRKANIRDALRRLRTSGIHPRGAVLTFAPSRALYGYGVYYGYGTDERGAGAALPGNAR